MSTKEISMDKSIRKNATPKGSCRALSDSVRIQRQRAILMKRLKVPPAINQFNYSLDKANTKKIIDFFYCYRPESRQEKQKRLEEKAEVLANNQKYEKGPKPLVVKFGLKHITSLIETKKAKIVLIADDVNPIELVVWMPALCNKMGIPYAIVKSKTVLGQLVHRKKAAVVALTEVHQKDISTLDSIIDTVNSAFLNRYDTIRKQWGGGEVEEKEKN